MLIKDHIVPKLKKYIFFISITFFVASFAHIFYIYIYNNAKISPLS